MKNGMQNFTERTEFGVPFAEAKIDGLVIHNVKLLGAVSKNNRIYSAQALVDARELYEGVRIMVDHPTDDEVFGTDGVRPFDVLIGKATNTRVVGDSVRGDIMLLEGEPRTQKVLSLARDMPELAGFSHRARGTITVDDDGVEHVESIEQVFAVELVTEPATSNGLFESVKSTPVEVPEMEIKDLTLAQLQNARPDLLEAITASVKESLKGDETVGDLETKVTDLTTKLKESEKKADELEAAGKLRDHRAMVASKLAEARLHPTVLSDLFKKNLEEAVDEDAVNALVEDRKALADKIEGGFLEASESGDAGGPKSEPRSVDENIKTANKKGELKEITSDTITEAATKLF